MGDGAKLMIVLMVVFIIVLVIVCIISIKKRSQLRRYTKIELGMPESEMLEIMGNGYNRSLLKNNRTKYEWRINSSSSGYSHGGVSTRSYTGVKKVDIYTKDGVVEEIKPYNV